MNNSSTQISIITSEEFKRIGSIFVRSGHRWHAEYSFSSDLDQRVIFQAKIGDVIVGYSALAFMPFTIYPEIYRIYVLPEYRVKKIGTLFVNAMIDFCKKNGNEGVVADILPEAAIFWGRYLSENHINYTHYEDKAILISLSRK